MSTKSPKIKIKQNSHESKILNFLSNIGYIALDSLSPKSYSYTHLFRNTFSLDNRNPRHKSIQHHKYIISQTLVRLKEKNLVYKENKTKKAIWKLTEEGKKIINALKDEYPPEDGQMRLFIFDIPQEKNRWRNWIREKLIISGYKMLQKSVWAGKRPLSSAFLEELTEKNLIHNIHFFEIKEKGTLNNLEL